ncbi:MAG: hypothetical protein FJX23_06145 [Alphaproteobacteria bacterium]|nr:hypothetical protein [Alphaproteobacteria bacterium]
MGFVDKLFHRSQSASQHAAVDAVFDLLERDQPQADRKEKDAVEATGEAVIVTHWGVEPEEATRKHSLAKEAFSAAGLAFREVPVHAEAKEVIGASQGMLILPAAENGGFAAIADKADALRLDASAAKKPSHTSRVDAERSQSASSGRGGRC